MFKSKNSKGIWSSIKTHLKKFNYKVVVMADKSLKKNSLDDYFEQIECNEGICDERDKYEAIRDKLRKRNTKVAYSIQDENNDLLDPETKAFEGVKSILLLDHSIEMESPNYIEIVLWIDSVLGSEASSRYFVSLEVKDNAAIILLE
jgi:hypothetical protein